MVTFGDSLSDNGNLYRFFWYKFPASPPYFEGRFSNGPLWIERLFSSYFPPEYSQGFQDYAVGGAGAVLSLKESMPFTLTVELNNYFYWHTYGKKETSLFTIWIGANNYLNGPTNVEVITESVTDAISGAVERIISYGGNKFFIPNLPDLGRIPQAKDMGNQELLARLVKVHNKKLAAKVDALRIKYPEVTIFYFDVYDFFNTALEHPNDYGLYNATDPCYLGGYLGWLAKFEPGNPALYRYLTQQDSRFTGENWDMIKNNPSLKEAAIASYTYQLLPSENKAETPNCEGYIFWDRVHPTTNTHFYLAEKARELLNEAGLEAFIPMKPTL